MSDSLRSHGLYSPWNSPGQNTGVGSLSLLQGIFPTQESNQSLLHCRLILYQLSYHRLSLSKSPTFPVLLADGYISHSQRKENQIVIPFIPHSTNQCTTTATKLSWRYALVLSPHNFSRTLLLSSLAAPSNHLYISFPSTVNHILNIT